MVKPSDWKQLNVRVPAELLRKFRVVCAYHAWDTHQLVIRIMERVIEDPTIVERILDPKKGIPGVGSELWKKSPR